MKWVEKFAATVAAAAALPLAAVPWKGLDRIPAEAVDGSGIGREEVIKRFDAIIAENAGKPFIAAKTKCLVALFDEARLSVKADDRFVDCFPEWYIGYDYRDRRVWGFLGKTPKALHRDAGLACVDCSHTCPDWNSVLALGPKGLADRARARRATAADDDERLFLDCVAEVYDAVSRLCLRWADVAEKRGAAACAADLREIAVHPPRTLAQALQWSLVYDRCQEAEGEDLRSQGNFDRLFLKFYEADIAAGRETRASAKELFRRVYDKFFAQGHHNGKNIALAGFDAAGRPVWNDISEILLELHYELNRVNPKFTFIYGRNTPRRQLLKAAKCLADGRTSIVFFNYDTAAEMFLRRGKNRDDLQYMGLIGCYEPAILGREMICSMAARVNLAKPLEAVMARKELPRDYPAFEAAYLKQLGGVIREILSDTAAFERHWYDLNPAPLLSGTFTDCIRNARDATRGGCAYNQSGCVMVGLGTAADSLAAVRYLVDERKILTMEELRGVLKSNWEGREELRLMVQRTAPKWGNNDDRVDLIAKRVYDFAAEAANSTPNGHGGTFQAGFWSIFLDMDMGRATAATPDGRRAKDPLSRNNVSTAGCGKEGPTALALSNAKLDLANSPDGHILDVILPASARPGDGAAERVASILETYAKLGGQSIHMNCFNSKTLRAAREYPENYPDLQVRVCGWNVLWRNLSKAEQDHFIATAEAQER